MLNKKKLLFLFSLAIGLTACSVFSPVAVEPANSYLLTSMPNPPVKKTTHRKTLLVNYPLTSSIYNTTQMAYSTAPFEIAYFSKNQWADTPSQMLLPLIANTLQKTQYFRQVITPGMLGQYDYILNTQLLKMQQVFFNHSSRVELVIKVQLLNAANNKIITTKDFNIQEEACPTPYGGVVAMNSGVKRFLSELAIFIIK